MSAEKLLEAFAVFEGFRAAFARRGESSCDIGVFETFLRRCTLQKTVNEACVEAVACANRVH